MPKLMMLIGPPGGGKSTFASRQSGYKVISCDKIREEFFGSANIQGGKDVWDEFDLRLTAAVRQEEDILIDNTNVKRAYRKQILDRCKGYFVEYVVFETPLEVCLRNNQKRDRHTPEDVIHAMYKTLEENLPLLEDECDKISYTGVFV